jgi:hypothetical protein
VYQGVPGYQGIPVYQGTPGYQGVPVYQAVPNYPGNLEYPGATVYQGTPGYPGASVYQGQMPQYPNSMLPPNSGSVFPSMIYPFNMPPPYPPH